MDTRGIEVSRADTSHAGAEAIRQRIRDFTEAQIQPVREDLATLQEERARIDAQIKDLEDLLNELTGTPEAAAGPTGRKRPTQAERQAHNERLVEAGRLLVDELRKHPDTPRTADQLRTLLPSGIRPFEAVRAWNARHPDQPIASEGKGRGTRYSLHNA